MENTLERIALCVEVGKINAKTPYPPAMKGEDGADELTQKALEQGYSCLLSTSYVLFRTGVSITFGHKGVSKMFWMNTKNKCWLFRKIISNRLRFHYNM